MRRVAIDEALPGMQLAKPVYDDTGRPLVTAGAQLSDRTVQGLRDRGFISVMIEDEETAGIEIFEVVTERTRAVALKSVARVQEVIAHARPAAGPGQEAGGEDAGKAAERLYLDVENIIDEIMDAEMIEGVSLLQSSGGSGLDISIDTAVVAVVVGKKLFLDRRGLHTVAAGSMLHDVGLSRLTSGLAEKPESAMTAEQLREFQTHTAAGFDIVRGLFKDQPLVAHVAMQHHERQDGVGFPRGLTGNNRVLKPWQERTSGKFITLISEIAQVARRFAELSSSGPWGEAQPPEVALKIMQQEAGLRLNEEVVKRFLEVAPPFPVGQEVVFTAGKLQGFRGIVAEVNPLHRDRPVVRVLRDVQGRPVKPVQLELWKYPDMKIASRLS